MNEYPFVAAARKKSGSLTFTIPQDVRNFIKEGDMCVVTVKKLEDKKNDGLQS